MELPIAGAAFGVMAIVAAELITLLLYRLCPSTWIGNHHYLLWLIIPLTGGVADGAPAHWYPRGCA